MTGGPGRTRKAGAGVRARRPGRRCTWLGALAAVVALPTSAGAAQGQPRPAVERLRAHDARQILDALDAYTGHWRTEAKHDPAGNTFHFEYDLEWMDEARTIARMLIERTEADGSRSTVFEGYKGREPSGEGVYYFAASPSGRASRGRVLLEEDRLITLYEGWTAEGDVVEIRDVFWPVEDGAFDSRTFLRPSPDRAWRQIGEDRWQRVG